MYELFDPEGVYLDVYNDRKTAEEIAAKLTKLLGRKISVRKIEVDAE